MDKIESFFLAATKPSKDGDFVDKLVYRYTVFFLVLFALLIFGWSFFGTPIQCWFPVQFTSYWNEYALDYCYVQNTYFEPLTESNSIGSGGPFEFLFGDKSALKQDYWLGNNNDKSKLSSTQKQNKLIAYYQWVPFIFALMAFGFYLPVTIWRWYYEFTGDTKAILAKLEEAAQTVDTDARQKCSNLIGYLLHFRTASYAENKSKLCRCLSNRCTFVLYLLVKFSTVLICMAQFLLLQHFLGLQNVWWGFEVVNDVCHNRQWTETGHFPRVTFCEFSVRELGNIHRHKIQCVLLINMLNEKIFVFLYFWFLLVAILVGLSFCNWLVYALSVAKVRGNIFAYLNSLDPRTAVPKSRNYHMARKFINDVITCDCSFFLRLIETNVGDVVSRQVIASLWRFYKEYSFYQFEDIPELPRRQKPRLLPKLEPPVFDDSTLPSRARLVQFKESEK